MTIVAMYSIYSRHKRPQTHTAQYHACSDTFWLCADTEYDAERSTVLTECCQARWDVLIVMTKVQGCCADLPGTGRWCTSVPTAVYISRRHPVSTKTSVFHLGRSVRSCCQTAYCWTSCFLCHWHSCLERSSCWRHFSTFSVHFSKTFKTASLSTLLYWPWPLN